MSLAAVTRQKVNSGDHEELIMMGKSPSDIDLIGLSSLIHLKSESKQLHDLDGDITPIVKKQ